MRSKKIEAYKQTLRLSEGQKEILIGVLLGDGHLETQNHERTYRLKIEHAYWQEKYTLWLYEKFKEWVLTPPQEKQHVVFDRIYREHWFSTISHGAFRFYAQQFYKDKHKVLPRQIERWLTPLVLAVWFMDDGSIKSKHHRALILNTQSFSKAENLILIKILENKFGVQTHLRPQRNLWQLYINSSTVEKFVELIDPYILPSMRYKLGMLGNTLPKL
ncbi:MAG: hypothetical protein HYV65_03275 [Candidatus Spechtbacteria bacterium]|nr:hypothetical protein [Candidatus Spechtbacteria bacterium]